MVENDTKTVDSKREILQNDNIRKVKRRRRNHER